MTDAGGLSALDCQKGMSNQMAIVDDKATEDAKMK